MTKEQKKHALRFVTDTTTLIEEPNFQTQFCNNCGVRECPFDSPNERDCPRYRAWRDIWDTLNDAQDKIMEIMIAAGCVA